MLLSTCTSHLNSNSPRPMTPSTQHIYYLLLATPIVLEEMLSVHRVPLDAYDSHTQKYDTHPQRIQVEYKT
jgi:hypothetical protein